MTLLHRFFSAGLFVCLPSMAIAQTTVAEETKTSIAVERPAQPTIIPPALELENQKRLQDAIEELATKTTEAKAKGDEAEKAKEQAAVVKNDKIIQWGITVGGAVSVVMPAVREGYIDGDVDDVKEDAVTGFGAGGLGYVAVFPAYWFMPDSQRAYCASSWGGGDETDATLAAMVLAKRWAGGVYDAIAADTVTNASDKTIVARYDIDVGGDGDATALVASIRKLEKASLTDGYAEKRTAIISTMASGRWNPSLSGYCVQTKFGLWGGLPVLGTPLGTVIKERDGEFTNQARRFDQIAAGGLTFSPNAYFSILVGLTVGTATQKSVAATAASPEVVGDVRYLIAPMLAFGINGDILNAAKAAIQ